MKGLIIFIFLFISVGARSQAPTDMKEIKGGTYVPLYGSDSANVDIDAFYLDTYPVTNLEFLDFIKENEKWQKSNIISLFAGGNYVSEWENDTTLGAHMKLQSPITNISWFVAKEYCLAQGKRLPYLDEWEYVAMASQTIPNAQKDSVFNQYIIEGYETPKTFNKEIGSTFENYWGIYDMHGLVWEWTMDFNSVLITGESRQDVDSESTLFCAGGAVNSNSLMNYAAFMRYAFRGSIKAKYCIKNQGFRCASNIE